MAGISSPWPSIPWEPAGWDANKKKSVVDLNLETWQLRNLFIADASVFPTSLGVNPQETIWAFATKCAEHIAKNVL